MVCVVPAVNKLDHTLLTSASSLLTNEVLVLLRTCAGFRSTNSAILMRDRTRCYLAAHRRGLAVHEF